MDPDGCQYYPYFVFNDRDFDSSIPLIPTDIVSDDSNSHFVIPLFPTSQRYIGFFGFGAVEPPPLSSGNNPFRVAQQSSKRTHP